MNLRLPLLVLILVTAVFAPACGRGSTAQRPAPRGDPALRIALAIAALERDPRQALTPDQARRILPLLKVLRDTNPEDREAARALADQIVALFTPEQRAALERLQRAARDRASQRGAGGAPGGPGIGPPGGLPAPGTSPDPARVAEVRRRAVERAIRILETKIGQ